MAGLRSDRSFSKECNCEMVVTGEGMPAQIAARTRGDSSGGQQLTVAALAAAPPPVQKQMICARLFPAVSKYQPELAGKITGILLEMDNSELLILLDNEHQLKAKVDEAVRVLEQAKAFGEELIHQVTRQFQAVVSLDKSVHSQVVSLTDRLNNAHRKLQEQESVQSTAAPKRATKRRSESVAPRVAKEEEREPAEEATAGRGSDKKEDRPGEEEPDFGSESESEIERRNRRKSPEGA
eukprot:s379_g40.t1